jgi:general secretion pathway protein K
MRTPPQQQGVALITAIMLVAIATLIAAKLSWDNQISIRRTETTLMQEQARMFAFGAEGVAIDILRQDDNQYDFPGDDYDWTPPIGPLEIGIEETVMGQMQGQLIDTQGRLNVNNLIPDTNGKVHKQFERLFNNLGVDTGLVDAIADWIDADSVPLGRGAEDGNYTALIPGYRPANNYFTSSSELRAVLGVDAETYELLLPHVTALHPSWCGGQSGITPVNVNYATAEVFEALHEDISPSQATAWVEQRGDTGWQDLSELTDLPPDAGTFMGVQSNCIKLRVIVNVGSSVLSMYSLLDRSGGTDEIITRTRAFGLE